MKIYNIFLLLLLVGWSCQMDEGKTTEEEDEGQPSPFEVIASNLLKDGSDDLELLTGEWQCIEFAFTEDGNTIVNRAAIDVGKLKFNGKITFFKFDYADACFCYPYYLNYSISDNLINFSEYEFDVVPTSRFNIFGKHDEDLEMIDVLMKTYSFVIRDDELIVHFVGVEDKNLIIFKKVEYSPPPSLEDTKWKFVGIVDVETGRIKELEPIDCEYCYTLTFYSDFHARVHNISSAYGVFDLSPLSIFRNPLILFEDNLRTELYNKDGQYYITNDFNDLLYHIRSYRVTEDELKIYYFDIYGIPPSERNTNIYSLFKKT